METWQRVLSDYHCPSDGSLHVVALQHCQDRLLGHGLPRVVCDHGLLRVDHLGDVDPDAGGHVAADGDVMGPKLELQVPPF